MDMALVEVTGSAGVPEPMLFLVVPPTGPPIWACPLNSSEFNFVMLDRETGGPPGSPGAQPERMRWHIGNAPPIGLYLHKTGDGIFGINPPPTQLSQIENMLLPGAVFALYRFTGTGTPPSGLVPAANWSRMAGLHTSTGDPLQPIGLRMGYRGDQTFSYYQLVELVAPVGHDVPFGQWRIRMDVNDLVTNDVTFAITVQGHAPGLVRLSDETGYVFAVGNARQFELPLTGGVGVRTGVMASGFAVVFAGFGAVGYLAVAGKGRRKTAKYAGR